MSKAIPKISKYMTTTPHSIEANESVYRAMELMQQLKIRHLPVLKQSQLIGLISERDVKTLLTLTGSVASPKDILVGDICADLPYVTKPDALLNEVATEMAEKKFGSAIVVDNGKLVGIFTAVDACQALSDICQQRFHP